MTATSNRTTALIMVLLASFLTPFNGSAVNIALPAMAKEFSLDAVLLGWIPTSYLLATSMVLLPAGRLADIYGRKRIFTYGVIIFAVTSALITQAPSAAVLIFLRVLQGIGGAMQFSTSTAILTSIYPPQEKGRALGLNVATVYVGLSVGPTLGGFLTTQFGWRSIFLFNVPLATLVAALSLLRLSGEWAEARGERFDLPGAILYGVSLLTVMYGFSQLPSLLGGALIVIGLAGFAAFVHWEGRAPSPLVNIGLFRRNTVFAFSNLAALINYCASAASGFLLSLYLQQIRGYSPQGAGFVLVAQPIVQAIFSPLTGRLSDTVQPRILASLGMACNALGLLLFTRLDEHTPIPYVTLVLVLLGLGFALFSSPNTNAIMSSVERRFYGVASASLSTMRVVGQTLSIGIAVLVFSLVIGRAAITQENAAEFLLSARIIYGVFAGLCLVGIAASLARGNVER